MGAAANEILMIDCESDQLEEGIIASAGANLQPIPAVTWEKVQKETARGSSILELIKLASTGFPEVSGKLPPLLLPCWRFRKGLMVIDDVLMYGNRTVIPPTSRKKVPATYMILNKEYPR